MSCVASNYYFASLHYTLTQSFNSQWIPESTLVCISRSIRVFATIPCRWNLSVFIIKTIEEQTGNRLLTTSYEKRLAKSILIAAKISRPTVSTETGWHGCQLVLYFASLSHMSSIKRCSLMGAFETPVSCDGILMERYL